MSEDFDLLLELLGDPEPASGSATPPSHALTAPSIPAPSTAAPLLAAPSIPHSRPAPSSTTQPGTRGVTATASLTARVHVLRVPFEERLLAARMGIKRDEAHGVSILQTEVLPEALEHMASQPYSWERWIEDDINAGREVTAPAVTIPRGDAVVLRDYQEEALKVAGKAAAAHRRGFFIGDEVGLGKAQPLDAQVLTPQGFRKMGDLQVGDDVIAADGSSTRITGVYDRGVMEVYEVSFSDGTSTRCSGDHLWWVSNRRRTRSKSSGEVLPEHWSAKTLNELVVNSLTINKSSGVRQAKWHIPMISAPNMDDGGVREIHPYVLGVLLGDGCLRGVCNFTTEDDELVEIVSGLVPDGVQVTRGRSNSNVYGFNWNRPTVACEICTTSPAVGRGLCAGCYSSARRNGNMPPLQGQRRHPVLGPLRDMGLMGHLSLDKFIPPSYLHASAEDRLALLQGLMDTDGSALPLRGGSATAQFYTSSPRLADDVMWLARSLGGTALFNSKFFAGRNRFTITINLPSGLNPFRISRKAKLWGEGHLKYRPTRTIVDVKKIDDAPVRCISIAHPSHLYVTDNFIVTHNTFEAIAAALARNPKRVLVFTPLSAVPQWRRSIAALDRTNQVRWLVINYDRAKSLLEPPKSAMRAKKTRTKNKHTATEGRSKVAWDVVIADEAHMLSNPVSQRTSAVRRLSGEEQSYQAFSLWLSATAGQTPLALSYLAPILREDGKAVADLDQFAAFMRTKGIQVETGSFGAWTWNPGTEAQRKRDLETIRALLFDGPVPLGIRRRPVDIEGWPERQRVLLPIELEPMEVKAYEMEWQRFRSEMHLARRKKGKDTPLVRQMRYRQKAEILKLRGMAEETRTQLANGYQVVVGLEFKESIASFVEHMGSESVSVITGDVAGAAREVEKLRFQRGDAPVVVTNVTAAIDLHAGDTMVGGNSVPRTSICSPRWSGISLHQFEGRSHRNGQYSLNRIAVVAHSVETTIAKVMLQRLVDVEGINGDDSEETAALIEDELAKL